MFYLSFDCEFDGMDELIKRLEWLDSSHVDVGMFASSGVHPSGYTYAGLFAYLSKGDMSRNMPPRPVLDKTFQHFSIDGSSFAKDLGKYLSDIDKTRRTKASTETLLKGLGKFYRDTAFNIFGKEQYLAPNRPLTKRLKEENGFDPNAPLVETGKLSKKIAYSVNDGTPYEYRR